MGISSLSAPSDAPTATTTHAGPTPAPPPEAKGMGMIAGIAVGALAFLGGVLYLYNRKRNSSGGSGAATGPLEHTTFADFHDHFQMSEYEQMMNLSGGQGPNKFV